MRASVDLFQLPDGHLRVNLGRFQIVADIGAAFEHQRRHGVAQQVASSTLADLGGVHMNAHQIAQMIEAERLTLSADA